ncbi:hypothetical protein [Mucilaginibacter pedocola]|nr:hypothetical protein [Mucilaginibacter pedocola]
MARFAAAKIVEKLGDEYLIFFERIHKEIINAQKQLDLKSLALKAAKKEVISI